MERAIRVISIERGNDPREFSLMSFGGAGGLHAVELARSLNIPTVLIPPDAGVFSAYGMVVADVTRDFSRTILRFTDQLNNHQLESYFSEMIVRGMNELKGEGIDSTDVIAHRFIDMRYEGQSHEITMPMSQDLIEEFHGSHKKLYGYSRSGSRVEIVTVRVRLVAVTAQPDAVPSPLGTKDPSSALIKARPLVFERREVEAGIYDRERLMPGHNLKGPALILESTSTIFLPPGSEARLDEHQNILIRPG
jgi:N-methylhydantoinase A